MYTKKREANEKKRPNDVAINGSTRRRAHLRPRRISDATRSSGNNSQDKECRRFMAQTCHAARAVGGRETEIETRFEGRVVWASVSAATNQCKDFFTINCVIESFRRRRTQQWRGRGGRGRGLSRAACSTAHGNGTRGGGVAEQGKFN